MEWKLPKLVRLRIGIVLIICSWLPIAQWLISVAHGRNMLTSEQAESMFRLVVWGIQWAVGLFGLWLVGQLAVKAAKQDGWKKAPGRLWRLFWRGEGI